MSFNAGRSFQDNVDLSGALTKHFESDSVKAKLAECHEWLTSKKDELSAEERKERGWDEAYNLTVWEEFPGQPTISGVLLQNVTGGRMGISGTGPSKQSSEEAKNMRKSFLTSGPGRP